MNWKLWLVELAQKVAYRLRKRKKCTLPVVNVHLKNNEFKTVSSKKINV